MRHDLNSPPDDAFARRLRAVRAVSPSLDRDHLMFLAGQRSAERPRVAKLWPILTAASWLTCAAVVGLLITRPPEVVTEFRTVERIVEVPIERDPVGPEPIVAPQTVVVAPASSARPPLRDLMAFELGRHPMTLLSSRPNLLDDEPIAVAEITPQPVESASSLRPSARYVDMRRELLPVRAEEPATTSVFGWF